MRDILTFTIDPKDAKDFDDALSLRKLENGNIEVGVHIADVSYYVQPGTLFRSGSLRQSYFCISCRQSGTNASEVLSNGVFPSSK